MNIRIVTDSTCDLPTEIVSKYAITVIPLHINVGDKTFLDGVDLSRTEFYEQLPSYDPSPKTAAPGIEVFTRTYQTLADEGAQAVDQHINGSGRPIIDLLILESAKTAL
jgi:DegV family protein with EDD domain